MTWRFAWEKADKNGTHDCDNLTLGWLDINYIWTVSFLLTCFMICKREINCCKTVKWNIKDMLWDVKSKQQTLKREDITHLGKLW